MKMVLKKAFIMLSKLIGYIFYDKKYLQGRWFNNSTKGWKWVWRGILFQKILGFNRSVPWPVSHQIIISDPSKIFFNSNDMNNFHMVGNYFQNACANIYIGQGSYIASNVGLITSNHDFNNLDMHEPGEDIIIGESCWIGMNSVILPGIQLGDRTIVGAGSIVTKSFVDGNCVIVGNPARIVKKNSI